MFGGREYLKGGIASVMHSGQPIEALSLAALCGIAVLTALCKRSHPVKATDEEDVTSQQDGEQEDITSQQGTEEEDITSQQDADETESVSQRAANEKDIISQLPLDVLVSIIGHMPIISAVRTSNLSKRWRSLYKFISNHVDFRCQEFWHPEKERILRLCPCFRSFRFRCFVTQEYIDRFEQCIYSLRRVGLEELVVYFSCCQSFPSCRKFSCCRRSSDLSFSCHLLSMIPTLKYFHLGLCSLGPNLESPCKSLETLSLTDVVILPGALESILANCSRLHSVTIDHCECPSILAFCGPNLPLESLILRDCEDLKELKLHADNLLTFEFHHCIPNSVNIIFDRVPHLESINVDSHNKNILPSIFEMLDQDSPYLKSIGFPIRDDYYQTNRPMGMGSKMFNNLRRLELKLYCTPTTNLFALTPFLESCPSLSEFRLSEFHLSEFHLDIPYNLNYDWGGARVQAREELVELKKVAISGFSGTRNEVEFVLYMLKSAVKLEQMCITWRYNCYHDYSNMRHKSWRQREEMEKLLKEQAGSRTAQVILKHALKFDKL